MPQNKKHEIGGFAGWILRAVQEHRMRKASRAVPKRMEMLETLSLGRRREVALVVCDGQPFLVAMTADSVTSIVPAPPQRAVTSEPAAAAGNNAPDHAVRASHVRPMDAWERAAEEAPRAAHRLIRFGTSV